jgi:hypothetical protein
MDRRQEFLEEFLGALGAHVLTDLQVTPTEISGTVIYDPRDPEESQDFRWSVPPTAAPSPDVIHLIRLIRNKKLLISDKLLLSRQDLLARFIAERHSGYSNEQFAVILAELLQVKVPMLDHGVEGDYFFIHE